MPGVLGGLCGCVGLTWGLFYRGFWGYWGNRVSTELSGIGADEFIFFFIMFLGFG